MYVSLLTTCRFGTGYTIKLRVGGGPDNVRKVINFMSTKFPGTHVKVSTVCACLYWFWSRAVLTAHYGAHM